MVRICIFQKQSKTIKKNHKQKSSNNTTEPEIRANINGVYKFMLFSSSSREYRNCKSRTTIPIRIKQHINSR